MAVGNSTAALFFVGNISINYTTCKGGLMMREDTYKEVLAKKYARESNYVIITPTDNLEELEELWNKFLSTMTIRQQRLCDDRSIQIYGMTNQQHYEALKADFIKHTKEPKKRDWGLDNRELNFKISPDDSLVNAKSDTFTTDTDSDFEGLIFEGSDGPYFSGSGIYVIPDIEGGSAKEQLEDLEKHYANYMSLTVHQRKLSDDGSRMMYGLSNQQRYDQLKGELLKDVDTSDDSDVVGKLEPDLQSDEANIVDEMFHDPNTFVGQHFLKSLEESKKTDKPVKSRLNNTPYFTPTELIDMGVHGNDNYYSQKADNDGLTKDISSTAWFDSYKNMIAQHVYEDFTAEWINTLNRLYLDYEEIKECGTEEELLARKQSILDLGWNPEVPFTPENRVKASKRINDYIDHCVPRDIFINMDDIVPDDLPDVVEEAVSKKTHKPVFIVLTKGKTPIISSSIQKVTKSEYSHASISFDPSLNELYSYNFRKENLGFVMEKLETIKDVPITVWCFFAESEVVENMKKKVYDFKTHDTHYDFRMLPRFIRKKDIKPDDNEYNQVCSTFVDTVLKAGNINLVRDINMPSPADIYDGIKTRANTIFRVYDGPAGQYNGGKIKKKVNYLLNKDTTEAVVENVYVTEALNDLKNGVNPYGNKTFYHLSFDEDLDEKTLTPRVPEWIKGMKEKDKDFEKKLEKFKTENNPDGYGYEDPKTPRICFSNSIEGALNAIINPNKRLHLAGKQIYVFVPEKPISEYKTRSNKVIKKNGDVFDANVTNEMWILEPCKVKFIGSIVVDKVTAKRRKKFTNNKEMNVMEYSYKWRWYHKISKKERFHESVSIFNEMKKFPVEFDKEGNLIIYKCSTGNIDFDEEIDNSVTLLETYRNTNNEEGMKYELAKMWYIVAELEKRMKKRNVPVDEYNKLVRQRSVAMNVFKTNFKHMSSLDKNFNFAAYYNSTPFSDNGVKITNNTLRYGLAAMKRIVR
jgi:hypothetical protein